MFKPWVSIPVDSVKLAVDYDFGDIRIIFKDTETVDNVMTQLEQVREIVKEMEGVE